MRWPSSAGPLLAQTGDYCSYTRAPVTSVHSHKCTVSNCPQMCKYCQSVCHNDTFSFSECRIFGADMAESCCSGETLTQMLFSAGHTGGSRVPWYICVFSIHKVAIQYLHDKSASSCSSVTLCHSETKKKSGKDECSQSGILRMDKE